MKPLKSIIYLHVSLFAVVSSLFPAFTSCMVNNGAPSNLVHIKKNVVIPVLAPLYGLKVDRFAYAIAARYAFGLINNRTDLLRDYHLIPEIHDTVVSTLFEKAAHLIIYHHMHTKKCSL